MLKNKIVPVIQREAGHDECVAALVRSLNGVGFRAIVFMPVALIAKRGSVFAFAGINHKIVACDDLQKTSIENLNENIVVYLQGKKDVIILDALNYLSSLITKNVFFTTFEKTDYSVVEKLSSKKFTINAFVHGPHQKNNLAQLFNYKNTRAIVFSRRMDDFLSGKGISAEKKGLFYLTCMTNVSYDRKIYTEPQQEVLKFVIPGKIDNRTRDYLKIIEVIQSIDSQDIPSVKFTIAGGAGQDGIEFKTEIERLNLHRYVDFPFFFVDPDSENTNQQKKFADYQEIKKVMQESHFSLDISKIDFRFSPKVSGTINLCIDQLVPVFFFEHFLIYDEFSWPSELKLKRNKKFISQILDLNALKNYNEIKQNYSKIKNEMCYHNSHFLSALLL